MSNRYQIIVLKGGLAFTVFAIKLFGFWPFRFVHCKNEIQYSVLKALYSIFVLLFGTFSYTMIGSIAFNEGNEFFGSFTLRLVGTIYAQTVITSFIFTYIGQHWFAKEIVIAYSKCKDIIMNEIFDNVDFSIYLPEIILKTIVIEILQEALTFNNITSASQLMISKPYLPIALMMPSIAVRFHTNIFYVGLVAIDVYTKQLNSSLFEIGSKIDSLNQQNIKRHKCHQMNNYCNFSDEIDKLSVLYLKLVQGTKALNTIFSIQIILWNTTLLFALTLQYLFQFVTIIEIIHDPNETVLMINLIGITAILISLIDLFVTTYASQRIVNTVEQTALILHETKIDRNVDIRLWRSIEVFSTQILMNKLEITECGMLTLDLKTTTLVITSIVSYSIVLLQFELTERKMTMNLKDKP